MLGSWYVALICDVWSISIVEETQGGVYISLTVTASKWRKHGMNAPSPQSTDERRGSIISLVTPTKAKMPKARKLQNQMWRKKNLAFIIGRNEVEMKRFYLLNLFSVINTPRGSVCYVHILTEINIDWLIDWSCTMFYYNLYPIWITNNFWVMNILQRNSNTTTD